MDNIRESIKILFNSSFIENRLEILLEDGIDEAFYFFNYRQNLFHNSKSFYNHEETERLENILKNDWTKIEGNNEKNIFNILLEYTKDILIEKNNEIVCKYSKLFKWRELSLSLGEDLFTTSYLAYNDLQENYERNNFDWGWIVKTDNLEIRNILSKGIAENHFHLLGSAPYFDIFWIYFMNAILFEENLEIKKYLDSLSKTIKPTKDPYNFSKEFKLYDLLEIAAIMRSYLFYATEPLEDKVENLFYKVLENKNDENCKNYKNYIKNINILERKGTQRYEKRDQYDYVEEKLINYTERSFESERAFLYKTFKESFKGKNWSGINNKVLYMYLLIKNMLKNEIMYFEKMYSLDDFLEFNGRKNSYFLPEKYKKLLYSEILKNTYENQNIKSLEIRLSFSKPDEMIKEIDKYLENDKYENNYFYVLHYNKSKDAEINRIKKNSGMKHTYKKDLKNRKEIRKKTLELIKLYRDSLAYDVLGVEKEKILKRILGIDAAGRELNCNPEVFGQAYRALRKVSRHKKLWFTYHVGEDFIDLTTGLRRIDEAIEFLELEAYDRLGHALALGIDPQNVYSKKNNKLLLKKGELLDNIAWLLQYIRSENIFFENNPRELLEIKYKELVKYIYGDSIDSTLYSEIWMLRGDNIFYEDEKEDDIYWINSKERDVNNKNLQRIRKMIKDDKKLFDFFKNYFIDYETNCRYDEIIEFEIPQGYETLVKKVQKIIQKKIKDRRICVETNPTSNYLISYLDKYQDHPIRNFFNIGLETDNEKILECNQLHVSINTDDQGIFYTCLENEYALVALSLEKLKDSNGRQLYSSYQVYEWLDKIREMGLQQSFANR
ncbi:hypothetical protein VSU16_02985 [Cetobacterium somerae]|uniref:hypothetical protein n=1 Tax=Cetobacterium somerae TaxID=188913 RepID=UPI002E7BD203|nr:hypothetical protein [Cetobacterium somerae]WVJ01706.1 hypothetical protein VSU16_02985 [Cetobacterium somerae]